MSSDIHRITSRIDSLVISSENIEDDEIKSHISRYLCVLISGFLEEVIKILIYEYSSTHANRSISNHVNYRCKKISNMNTKKILDLLATFDELWKESLEFDLSDEEKDSIDSVVANRNLIAHGKDTNISFVRVKGWWSVIKKVITKLGSVQNCV